MSETIKLISLTLLLALHLGHANAQESPYLAGAKKEGQVNLYATASPTTTQALVKAFEQRYPFIKTDYVRVGAENMLSKIRTEKSAGKLLFDVIYGGVAPLLTTLDVLQPYVSTEARAYADKCSREWMLPGRGP